MVTVAAGTAAVVSSDDTYLKIEAEPSKVSTDELFFVNVYAVASTPVNAVDIVVAYPEEQMEVTGIDTGESVITLWTEEPYTNDGKVHMRGGTFRNGFVGEHLIARIRGIAKETGNLDIDTSSVSFIAGDGEGTNVPVADSSEGSTRVYITTSDGSLVGVADVRIITDIDGDGSVDLGDISAFMSAWRTRDTIFDFNDDGSMNFRDFGILLADSFFK